MFSSGAWGSDIVAMSFSGIISAEDVKVDSVDIEVPIDGSVD